MKTGLSMHACRPLFFRNRISSFKACEVSSFFAGAVLCHPQFPVPLVTKLEARVVVLDVAMPLLQGQQVNKSMFA